MSSNDVAISVRDLAKTYRIFGHPGDRLKQAMSLGLKRYHKKFTALQDVSFDVARGEAIGIVGRNGCGKSTLLQLVCGILKPTRGTVRVDGRISALLELGAGFSPEFTGRENVYFQSALQGLTKKAVDARFDDIAAFADIGEFIDQPVRTYSSGMFVRLAFATIIHVQADILVVDEALAVGDEAFQRKCFDRLEELLTDRKTVLLLVTHNIRQVERMCSRAFLLDGGRIMADGPAGQVCDIYQNRLLRDIHSQQPVGGSIKSSGEIEVLEVSMFRPGEPGDVSEIEMHAPVGIAIRFRCRAPLSSPEIVVGFHTTDSIHVASTSSAVLPERPDFRAGEHRIECLLPDMMLSPGVYYVRAAFFDRYRRVMWNGQKLHACRVVPAPGVSAAHMPGLSLVDLPFFWRFDGPEPVSRPAGQLCQDRKTRGASE